MKASSYMAREIRRCTHGQRKKKYARPYRRWMTTASRSCGCCPGQYGNRQSEGWSVFYCFLSERFLALIITTLQQCDRGLTHQYLPSLSSHQQNITCAAQGQYHIPEPRIGLLNPTRPNVFPLFTGVVWSFLSPLPGSGVFLPIITPLLSFPALPGALNPTSLPVA